ncbi:MAG: hypothetical protein H0T42_32870 [Deltaproteobacteria bacterium]|nr:hypothetical protein [Deltaproteobacteria bacterium]
MVSRSTNRLVLAALPIAALVFAASPAAAQDYADPPPPPQPMQQPVYPAPLSQTTQTTYVPQSVAMSGPEEIDDFDFERPIPAGYSVVKRPRLGLLIGGGVTLGVSYMYGVLFAAAASDASQYDGSENELAALWIPVAGPFLQMAQTDSATGRVLLFGLGAAQTTGAIMLYYGLTTKKSVLVRNDIVGSMTITPMAGNGATGALLSGRF